jgi:DnaK suppressor protein
MSKTLTAAAQRARLTALRQEVEERLVRARIEYDELSVGSEDVGAGEDEGGSEADVTFFERDRLRAGIVEDEMQLELIDAALARTDGRDWKRCKGCGEPIGDPRLEALPTTDVCVTCKTANTTWAN